MWGTGSGNTVIATGLKLVPPGEFFERPIFSSQSNARVPKYIGFIPYDTFCQFEDKKAKPVVFEICSSLTWAESQLQPDSSENTSIEKFSLCLKRDEISDLLRISSHYSMSPVKGVNLLPTLSDESYVSSTQGVLDDIRKGKYYQLNLLRYFKLSKPWSWEFICRRLFFNAGSYGCALRIGGTALASFSPERFISIAKTSDNNFDLRISAWPIKGTAERSSLDPAKDEDIKAELKNSQKNLAELQMIIDLMRNDLIKVCKPSTVQVVESSKLVSLAHLHHLQGEISGILKSDLRFKDLFLAFCPSGSITGAPKIEVMKTIRNLEGRARGYMMGNCFISYSDGTFDSNVLIRTAVSNDNCQSWEYAAGSGIVIKSTPKEELQEIFTKCQVISK
jgi:para-aminobenzoate synthetase component 1